MWWPYFPSCASNIRPKKYSSSVKNSSSNAGFDAGETIWSRGGLWWIECHMPCLKGQQWLRPTKISEVGLQPLFCQILYFFSPMDTCIWITLNSKYVDFKILTSKVCKPCSQQTTTAQVPLWATFGPVDIYLYFMIHKSYILSPGHKVLWQSGSSEWEGSKQRTVLSHQWIKHIP